MAKVEFGMIQFSAGKPRARPSAAAAALAAIALCASACSMIDQFNPFGAEKYKMEIVPDTPRASSTIKVSKNWPTARRKTRRRNSPTWANNIPVRTGLAKAC